MTFEIKNVSNDIINVPPDLIMYQNKLTIYQPSGILYSKTGVQNAYIALLPGKSHLLPFNQFDFELLHTWKAKENGEYRIVWENERLGFNVEYEHDFNYNATVKKYRLENVYKLQ